MAESAPESEDVQYWYAVVGGTNVPISPPYTNPQDAMDWIVQSGRVGCSLIALTVDQATEVLQQSIATLRKEVDRLTGVGGAPVLPAPVKYWFVLDADTGTPVSQPCANAMMANMARGMSPRPDDCVVEELAVDVALQRMHKQMTTIFDQLLEANRQLNATLPADQQRSVVWVKC